MKRRTVTLLFLNIIAPVFQYPVSENNLTTGVNAEWQALRHLDMTDLTVDWKNAFGRLAKIYLQKDDMIQQKDDKIRQKDDVIRKYDVLSFIRVHMENILRQTDRLHYKPNGTSSLFMATNTADISHEDIPKSFQGTLEADFKIEYKRWYRIIMNSKDPRITALLDTLKKEPLNVERPLTVKDIAKSLAVIWCTACLEYDIHPLVLDYNKGQVIWQNADEVANAFAIFQEDGFYVDFVRIFMKVTKFSNPTPH